MCAVILQYSVPCLFLKYMKPNKPTRRSDSKVTILRTNTTSEYCFVKVSETMQYYLVYPGVKIDLSVCSIAKHGCSVNPLDMFA